MRISGNTSVDAPSETIWALIFDPTTLLQLLPGCDQVEQVDPNLYKATLTMHVPALSGKYEILIKIAESKTPQFCRLEGSARGPGGGVQGTGTLILLSKNLQTLINYEGEFQISGPLSGMPTRFVEGVAQTLIRQGLIKLAELASKRTEPKP
jgi:carbon monoxide dehydrogenase subunit G